MTLSQSLRIVRERVGVDLLPAAVRVGPGAYGSARFAPGWGGVGVERRPCNGLRSRQLEVGGRRRAGRRGCALALPCHEIFVWTTDFPRGMLVPCHSPRSAAHCVTRRRLRA